MTDKKFNIIVLASGNGTDLGAIIDAQKKGRLQNLDILGVIASVDYSGALRKAKEYGCAGIYVSPEGKTQYEYSEKILGKIEELESKLNKKLDMICLIGFIKILSEDFVRKFPKKIINVHPALLPNYGGKGMYGRHVHEAVLKAGEKETGMTIHYVDVGVDTGEIILQKRVKIEVGDSPEDLRTKVLALEKEGYIEVLEKLSSKK